MECLEAADRGAQDDFRETAPNLFDHTRFSAVRIFREQQFYDLNSDMDAPVVTAPVMPYQPADQSRVGPDANYGADFKAKARFNSEPGPGIVDDHTCRPANPGFAGKHDLTGSIGGSPVTVPAALVVRASGNT
jgi:hypothetical protein